MGRAAAASWTFHSVYRFHHLADTHRPWTTDWILFFFFVFLPALLSRTTINRRNRIMWPLSLGTQQAGLVESFRFPRSEPCDDDNVQFLFHSASPLVNLELFSSLIVLVSPVRVWLSLWSKASGRFFFHLIVLWELRMVHSTLARSRNTKMSFSVWYDLWEMFWSNRNQASATKSH